MSFIAHKKLSSVNLQHDQPILETKGLDDQSGETHTHEGIMQLEVDVLSVTEYRLYKRRWIGLGASPSSPKRFHFAYAP